MCYSEVQLAKVWAMCTTSWSKSVRGGYVVASHDNTLVEGGAWPYAAMAIERSVGIWLKSDDDALGANLYC